jgi:hypothetical protein
MPQGVEHWARREERGERKEKRGECPNLFSLLSSPYGLA